MKFGGMIGYYPGTIWLDFGIDRVKGQGHEKVNIILSFDLMDPTWKVNKIIKSVPAWHSRHFCYLVVF